MNRRRFLPAILFAVLLLLTAARLAFGVLRDEG